MMSQVVPPRFLFRFAFPVRYLAPTGKGSAPPELTDEYALPALTELDGAPAFAAWRMGWNEQGLGLAVRVTGKRAPLQCTLASPRESDGVQVWLDTRCTQNVHRATRFCHHFCLLPAGAGRQRQQPFATQVPLPQAREAAAAREGAAVQIASTLHDDGYDLRAWFPASSLTGYDPAANPRLGFYSLVRDAELGEQPLTVGREFPYDFDPSLWQTLELVR